MIAVCIGSDYKFSQYSKMQYGFIFKVVAIRQKMYANNVERYLFVKKLGRPLSIRVYSLF